jgi:hypothetical protein
LGFDNHFAANLLIMLLEFLARLVNHCSFSSSKVDDLKDSDRIVRRLSLSEQTKQFVYAIYVPESKAVVYVLAAQNLSERSVSDAVSLIKEVRPQAVVAEISLSTLDEILAENSNSRGDMVSSMPTTSFGVLKDCVLNKISKEMHEKVAGNLVLQEIFGVGSHEHVIAAKRAAEEVGSCFFLFRSSFVNDEGNGCNKSDIQGKFQPPVHEQCGLFSQKSGCVSQKRFCLTDNFQLQSAKSCAPEVEVGNFLPRCNYQAPPFAQPIYPLLTDLRDIFGDLPSLRMALVHAQKMLVDVNRGEFIDAQTLAEVQTFRIGVEGLRIALNSAARRPMISKMKLSDQPRVSFSELSMDGNTQVLLAQALKNQTKNFESIVAIVEAKSLAGLRKNWKTPTSLEVEDLAKQCLTGYKGDKKSLAIEKKLTDDKTMVAVGAGDISVSTVLKLAALKAFVLLELFSKYMQDSAIIAFGNSIGPSNASALKAGASAQKMHALVHSFIASAERTSFQIMRTTFYEIMRKRGMQPIGSMLWSTFGCSLAICSGLFVYGEGVECAVESLPAAPSMACLGRGVRSLYQASQEASRANCSKMQERIDSLMYSSKSIKIYQ